MTVDDLKRICEHNPYLWCRGEHGGVPGSGWIVEVLLRAADAWPRASLTESALAGMSHARLLVHLFGREALRHHPKRSFFCMGFTTSDERAGDSQSDAEARTP